MNTETPVARALRTLQLLDEVAEFPRRDLLLRAQTLLGEELGLECTGEESGWNEDDSVAFYSHDGDTCPIHEWLVPHDSPDYRTVGEIAGSQSENPA